MQSTFSLVDRIHSEAVDASNRYKKAEYDLIQSLQKAEDHRVFLRRGHSSLFKYMIEDLGLSESVACNLITVSRKAREVPELMGALQQGKITLSNARKIAPVLTQENQAQWLTMASELSNRQLEKEVVKVRPQGATPERASYVTETRVRVEIGMDEKDMVLIRRVQDLMSQKLKRPVTLEEVWITLSKDYVTKNDPVARAKRKYVKRGFSTGQRSAAESTAGSDSTESNSQNQTDPVKTSVTLKANSSEKSKTQSSQREPIPAKLRHQVNMRDQGRCAHTNSQSERCSQRRWLEIHHKVPVSKGGKNTLENLVTLCAAHHKYWHLRGAS